MRLYYRPRSGRPFRVAWALEELGVEYETVSLSSEECRGPEHLARHPIGRVPVLELDDGTTLFESTAIVLDVADRHPRGGLIGPLGSLLRAEVYEWSIFAMTEVERPLIGTFSNALVQEQFRENNRQAAALALAAVGRRLAGSEFLLGDSLTAADIVVGGVLAVVGFAGLVEILPEPVAQYLRRLQERPAYARSHERTESVLPR
jgi:glutathione S-transferase